MARLAKWDIAVKIEQLPGNTAWSNESLATILEKHMTRSELVAWHNRVVEKRHLDIELIS